MPISRFSSKNSSCISRGLGVEVAGRLVTQQQPGRQQQRPGQRHPLLLAARQLARPVGQALAQPDPHQQALGLLGALAPVHAADQAGHHGVFQRGELGQQMMELEHEADRAIAKLGEVRRR
jgi:hypothetical protein